MAKLKITEIDLSNGINTGKNMSKRPPTTTTTTTKPPTTTTTTTIPPTLDYWFYGNLQNSSISQYHIVGWTFPTDKVQDTYLEDSTFPQYYKEEIVVDANRNVLKFSDILNRYSNGSVSRPQFNIEFKNTYDAAVYHTSHRMFIHPDVDYLKQYPSAINPKSTPWLTLYEIWNAHDPNMDGDGGGSARWNLNVAKDAGAGSQLYWALDGEYMQPDSLAYHNLFNQSDNRSVPIPLGVWFTLDFYFKRGDNGTGQIKITIQPDNGSVTTLFDIAATTMYPSRPDLHLYRIQPFKIYAGEELLTFMSNASKEFSVKYNDFYWYKN